MEKFRGVTGIYKITNPIGQVYIGKSENILTRLHCHKSGVSGSKLKNSYGTYGFDNHKFELVIECSKSELTERELFYINLHDSINNGLNIRGDKKPKVIVANERNAGRIPTYNVPTKLKRVPIIAEGDIDKILTQYLTKKTDENDKV